MSVRNMARTIAALALGPNTAKDLAELLGIDLSGCGRQLKALQDEGMVYRSGYGTAGHGRCPQIFALQPSPFFHPDAPKRIVFTRPVKLKPIPLNGGRCPVNSVFQLGERL